jgi:hypothetical protein
MDRRHTLQVVTRITMQNGRRTVVLRNKAALCRLREAD